MGQTVPYEADLQHNDQPGGVTPYYGDDGYPAATFSNPVFHQTDMTEDGISRWPTDIVEWTELDLDIGGGPGLADRNAYVLGGLEKPDAHDFRGDHALVPREAIMGSYGDVGYGSEDYPTQYTQGVAAQDYETPTSEESWDAVSYGF